MSILDIFKKRDENVPPDVGGEDDFEKTGEYKFQNSEESKEEIPKPVSDKNSKPTKKEVLEKIKEESQEEISEEDIPTTNLDKKTKRSVVPINYDSRSNFEIEKINAKIEEMKLREEQVNERLSRINETIGELRAMNLTNEKKIVDSTKESDKVVDMFKEIKPNELRIEYQKIDMRLQKLEERIEANKQMVESVLKDFGNLRKESETFLGTDGLVKLNEDVKNDLVEIQKISEKTRMHADKTKEIFLNIKSNFEESQKISDVVNNLNESFSAVREEIEGLKINHEDIVKRSDYSQFKKTFGNKISVLDSFSVQINSIKEDNNKLSKLVEDSLAISQRNAEDIGDIGLKVGSGNVRRVADYENQLADVLDVVETLADQISEFKKRIEAVEKKKFSERSGEAIKKIFPVKKEISAEPIQISEEKNENFEQNEEAEIEKDSSDESSGISKKISGIREKFRGLIDRAKNPLRKNIAREPTIAGAFNIKRNIKKKRIINVGRKIKKRKIVKMPKRKIKKTIKKKISKRRR